MKLADAEQLLKVVKLQGLTERWSVLTDEGILLEAWPLGYAKGSAELQLLEAGWNEITMRSRSNRSYALYEGCPQNIYFSPKWSPHHLWQQEMYVYMLERQRAVAKALINIDKATCFPRQAETDSSFPQPEDWHLYPAVMWTLVGRPNIDALELYFVKQEFCELLEVFTKEEKWNAERKVVRVRSAVPPETDQGTERPWGDSEIGDID
jgi:hypothetical protein